MATIADTSFGEDISVLNDQLIPGATSIEILQELDFKISEEHNQKPEKEEKTEKLLERPKKTNYSNNSSQITVKTCKIYDKTNNLIGLRDVEVTIPDSERNFDPIDHPSASKILYINSSENLPSCDNTTTTTNLQKKVEITDDCGNCIAGLEIIQEASIDHCSNVDPCIRRVYVGQKPRIQISTCKGVEISQDLNKNDNLKFIPMEEISEMVPAQSVFQNSAQDETSEDLEKRPATERLGLGYKVKKANGRQISNDSENLMNGLIKRTKNVGSQQVRTSKVSVRSSMT